jgi:hypothetical protein
MLTPFKKYYMQRKTFLNFNQGKDYFSFTVNNTGNGSAKIILFPSYSPSNPAQVLSSGPIPAYGVPGAIQTFVPFDGGGGIDGNYVNVPLSGGTGAGATIDINIENGGMVYSVLNNRGSGYTVGNVLTLPAGFAGGLAANFTVSSVTTSSPVSGATASQNTIESFHEFIDGNPTIATTLQISTDNELQFHQLLNIIPKEPYKSLENKVIALSSYVDEHKPNQKIITIADHFIPLDNKHELNIIIPPATSTTFLFVCSPE